MSGVREAIRLLESAVMSGALASLCREHQVDLLVMFGSAVEAPDPGDIDLAVALKPGEPHDFLRFLDGLAALVPGDYFGSPDVDVGQGRCAMGGVSLGVGARVARRFGSSYTSNLGSHPCALRLYSIVS